MKITLTPEQEKIVKDELSAGHFHTAEEVIAVALQALRERERLVGTRATNGDRQAAVDAMLAFVESNRVRLEGISVKELIHEGHRL